MEQQSPDAKAHDEKKDGEKETAYQTTLKELQNQLPIHLKEKTDQTFTFKDWGMSEEETIAKMKGKNPTMGKFVSGALCEMLSTLNGEDFSSLEDKRKKLIINQQFSANVLYMYLYLRYDQVDSDIRLGFTCPHCNTEIKNFIASLDDLDVDCKHGEYEEGTPYQLRKPITLTQGNQTIETLRLGLSKWDVMERAEHRNGTKEYDGMRASLLDGIKGVEGVDRMVSITDIVNSLKKKDMIAIHAKLSEVNAGPDLTAEVSCDQCGKTAHQMIDWSYDGFFGVSSLPLP